MSAVYTSGSHQPAQIQEILKDACRYSAWQPSEAVRLSEMSVSGCDYWGKSPLSRQVYLGLWALTGWYIPTNVWVFVPQVSQHETTNLHFIWVKLQQTRINKLQHICHLFGVSLFRLQNQNGSDVLRVLQPCSLTDSSSHCQRNESCKPDIF